MVAAGGQTRTAARSSGFFASLLKERASKNFTNPIKLVKHRLKSKSTMRVRQPGAPGCLMDFLRRWEEETFIPVLVRREVGLVAKDFDTQVAARAADSGLSGNGGRRPQTAGRKNRRTPLQWSAKRQGCRVNQNSPKGVTHGRSQQYGHKHKHISTNSSWIARAV